ncbi:MAG TPA: tetratricopeptide repeat protein, partial [Blastocatellia bacterium]
EAHRNLGRALYESGALIEARAEFETAILQRESDAAKAGLSSGIRTTQMRAATRKIGEGEGLETGAYRIADSQTRKMNEDELSAITDGGTALLGSPVREAPSREAGDAITATSHLAPQPPAPRQYPEAHLDLGRLLYDLGNSGPAIEEFRTAIEQRGGRFPRAHYELGRALIRAGKYTEAMAELRTAIEQQGGVFPEAHFQIGLLQSRQGNSGAAIEAFHTAVEQSGGIYPEAYYQIGSAHIRSRNTESAVEAYRKAIEQRGGYYPEAHQDLGRVLYSIGDLEAANEEYSIAVRQRGPRVAEGDAAANRNGQSATSEVEQSRRSEAIVEELETALRQAPAAADSGKPAATAARADSEPGVLPELEQTGERKNRSALEAEGD